MNIVKDENLQGTEKAIFKIFSVLKFFEHNITYCKLKYKLNNIKTKYINLSHVNNVILTYVIFWLILKHTMAFWIFFLIEYCASWKNFF